MTRLQVMGLAVQEFGPQVEIEETRDGMKFIGRTIRARGEPLAFASYGVSGRTYKDLYDGIRRHRRNWRAGEAVSWRVAAFDAAAQGYDVREPAQQLSQWIEKGYDPEEEP